MFVYFERERGKAWAGEGQRGRERIPSRLHAVSTDPDVGLESTNHEIMTWAEIKSQRLNWLSHPGTPMTNVFALSLHLSYFHHHSIVCTLEIPGLPFSLFENGQFSVSISFLMARQTHVSLFPDPWTILSFTTLSLYFLPHKMLRSLGTGIRSFTSQWFLKYLKQFRHSVASQKCFNLLKIL